MRVEVEGPDIETRAVHDSRVRFRPSTAHDASALSRKDQGQSTKRIRAFPPRRPRDALRQKRIRPMEAVRRHTRTPDPMIRSP
eukprot:scaffold2603_cov100-Isochrysis_galbana.AAC.5